MGADGGHIFLHLQNISWECRWSPKWNDLGEAKASYPTPNIFPLILAFFFFFNLSIAHSVQLKVTVKSKYYFGQEYTKLLRVTALV